jgi:hypothetical protein
MGLCNPTNMLTYLKRLIAAVALHVFLSTHVFAQQYIAEGRFPLAPLPAHVNGVKSAVTSLNGNWEIDLSPSSAFWNDRSSGGSWKNIQVPGEPTMQGFSIKHDVPFVYRKKISIPVTSSGKAIIIRFNGVYSYTRVWVNGNFIREHYGGFTAWDCDITKYVKPGKEAYLYVEVTDKIDDISYASGYAHHLIGGILRKVQMLILPSIHVQRLYADASLDDQYQNGKIRFDIALNKSHNNGLIKYNLIDPDGKKVWEKTQKISLREGEAVKNVVLLNVQKWTAENPLLYKLEVAYLQNNKVTERIEQFLGFRKVEVKDRALLVNGRVTKLRGACRHDIHPLLGRSTNRQQDSTDVALAKEANINFIRTSHYPPSADFLEFCNKYGIYVQEETAVCFASNTARPGIYKKFGGSHNNPAYTAQYLGQLSEMIDHDRNNPSIIMWSIGNESAYGINFQKEYEFVKAVDLSRPVSWSWTKTAIDSGKRCFDIAVAHYPDYKGEKNDLGGLIKGYEHKDYPVLSDEWAHVACYNKKMLKYDPNVSDFWGKSLDHMWANRFDVPGNTGGAIWGMIDEIFYQKDTVSGYGPWGFIDVWRRKKPEFWNVKKAYSPIRVLQTTWDDIKGGKLNIPVKNRFDHTNLSAIKLRLTQGGKTTTLSLPDIEPHKEGIISLPLRNNDQKEALLQFIDRYGNLLDEEKITWGKSTTVANVDKGSWNIEERGNSLILNNGNNLEISLNSETGDLQQVSVNKKQLINGAVKPIVNKPVKPFDLYRTGEIFSGKYEVTKSNVLKSRDKITVQSDGFVDKYPVKLVSTYYANGQVEIDYSIDSIPDYTWQIGLEIPLSSSISEIEWLRKGYWSTYPADHLSSISGIAKSGSTGKEGYRVKPEHNIKDDAYNYYIGGSTKPDSAFMGATEAYRATKENIYHYKASDKLKSISLIVTSDGSQAAKMNVSQSGAQALQVLNQWAYWGLAWGNYEGEKNIQKKLKGTVKFNLLNK